MLRAAPSIIRSVTRNGAVRSLGLRNPLVSMTAPVGSVAGTRSMATIVSRLNELNEALTHRDAIRYDKQANMKW